MAIDYAFKQGWTYAEVFDKIRCCLYKDLSFDFYDWTKEPIEPWDKILKDRLQWFRDNYNYISFCYIL